MYQHILALCMFSGEVTWPVCTEEDKRISWSDIVLTQPPISVDKYAEHAECQNMLIHPRSTFCAIFRDNLPAVASGAVVVPAG